MANNKKRAGTYSKSNIKTSDFLPNVFQTNINKRWLDSTLDQMVSKSDLRQIDGFIGNRSGLHADSSDIYISPGPHASNRARSQFSPAILTKNRNGTVDDIITFDDVTNAVSDNFDSYNYNAAYASDIYGYYPPYDVDKFLNYLNYYWVKELPVYESVNNTSTDVLNPVADSLYEIKLTIADDNNTFVVEDNMLIKFTGSQWDSEIQGNTYIVVGVGAAIKLLKYKDAAGHRFYPLSTKADAIAAGVWDNTPYYSVIPNKQSTYWAVDLIQNPMDMITAFNADPAKLPIFNGFTFTDIESNPTQYFAGQLIKFAGPEWDIDEVEKAKIYYTEIDESGVLSLQLIVNAEMDLFDTITTQIVPNLPDHIVNLLDGWDTDYYDSTVNNLNLRDYLVIVKHDEFNTAWSRGNHWVNISTIRKVHELTNKSFKLATYINQNRIAERPIIEMTSNISLWDFSDTVVSNIIDARKTWLGPVDFIINLDEDSSPRPVNGNLTYTSVVESFLGSTLISDLPGGSWDGNTDPYSGLEPTTLTATLSSCNVTNQTWSITSVKVLGVELFEYAHWILDGQNIVFLFNSLVEFDGTEDIEVTYEYLPIDYGSTAVFYSESSLDQDYKNVYRFDAPGVFTPLPNYIVEGNNTAFVDNVFQQSMISWVNSDVWYHNIIGKWSLGQQKTSINQSPLYRLYTITAQRLEDIPGSYFRGSKIFGYKIGTGNPDPVLGFPLSYKDSPKGADYEFENFILTDKYQQSYSCDSGNRISHLKTIPGFYLFKTINKLGTVYTKSEILAGTHETLIYEIDDATSDLVIPYGTTAWRPNRELLISQYVGEAIVTELTNKGLYLDKKQLTRNIVVTGINQTIVMHNLIQEAEIQFLTLQGHDIENPPLGVAMPDVSIIRNSTGIEIVIGDADGEVINARIINGIDDFLADTRIIITKYQDSYYHTVAINGKFISLNDYIINDDNIIIDSDLLTAGDLVDFRYYTIQPIATTANTSRPKVWDYNPKNETISTFTISETRDHWQSLISQQPGFDGDVYGYNNYATLIKQRKIGGTIFASADSSIMHDIAYANKTLDVSGALIEQGADWDIFLVRFKSQVKRLYSTKAYNTVFDLVTDAANALITNRKGGTLYKNSNMVFAHKHNVQRFIIAESTVDVYGNLVVNGDDNVRDHLYVYLSDDRDNTGAFIQRILTKDLDYTFVGNKISLLVTPNPNSVTGVLPYLDVYYHQMDEDSYVAPSPVKLKLQDAVMPMVVDNILYTHDGRRIQLNIGVELDDPTSSDFDPVNAALYDLEKRIYAGLVAPDVMYGDNSAATGYVSAYHLMPSQHRDTWYTLEKINNYIERHYYKWARERDITDLNTANYYDVSDTYTWNYSSIIIDQHFTGNTLPGHWTGAYMSLFDTCTPHLTPWHMLGHSFKPTWWDEYYDWVDTNKRARLINSLKYGIIGKPRVTSEVVTQKMEHARYYWDWATKCPVTTAGELEDPSVVLGTPSDINKAKAYVFGDWSPVEQQWRNSSQGYLALVDAIVKLSPSRGWTNFFQPGTVDLGPVHLNTYDKKFPTTSNYLIPGKVYNNIISSFEFSNSIDKFNTSNTQIYVADGQGTVDAYTIPSYSDEYSYDVDGDTYSTITALSIVSRGFGFVNTPAIRTTFSDSEKTNSTFKLHLKQVECVASGISQAQYNYILRNQHSTDLDQLYSTLDAQLTQKIGGFTSKHLINLHAESGAQGAFRLSDDDYVLKMYTGYSTENVTASQVIITKSETGYVINGVSSQAQEFRFYEPDMTVSSGATNIGIGNTSIRKYKKFSGQPSIIQFGAKLARIQDTYNFVRGYWHWLELSGYTLGYNGDAQATRIAQWAVQADDGASIILEIGNEIKFTPLHGAVYEYNNYRYHKNDIMNNSGDLIEVNDLSIDRLDGMVTIKTKDGSEIGSITSSVLDNEHIIVFNNKTGFGVTIFDAVTNIRYYRLHADGQITDDWRGEKKAPGYLVFDDHIKQNFDSSVSQVSDYYRTDVAEFNPAITKTKDLTIGNIGRDWISNLGLSKNTVTQFYQGVIREKGTGTAIDKIARTTLLDHGTTQISANEQFMFNQGYLGENKVDSSIEIELRQSQINSNPQIIKFSELSFGESYENILVYAEGDPRIVFGNETTFDTIPIAESSLELLTAGEPLDSESKYYISNMSQISDVFEDDADYAIIPTWTNTVSFKLGDTVRYAGGLYRCLVNATGLNIVSEGISVTGITSGPLFPNGTVANIAGTSTTFQRTATEYEDIIATGATINPSMLPDETLEIDGVSIGFEKSIVAVVVTAPAVLIGSAISPTMPDVTGHSMTINGESINFDITPSDVVENFVGIDNGVTPSDVVENFVGVDNGVTPSDVVENITGVGAQQTYTISQALSPTTYSIATVTVDGTVYIETTDWTISGQDITFVTPTFTGSEAIVITLAHEAVIDLEDTFTLAQAIGGVWSLSTVTVDAVSQTVGADYNLVGQDIVFVVAPSDLAVIQATVTHTTVVDLEDTFTVATTLGVEWALSTVTVDATLQVNGVDYNLVGQDIVFVVAPADLAAIQATASHIPVSLTTQEIVDEINTQLTNPNIVADITPDEFSRIRITLTTVDPEELLIISPTLTSNTNDLLGFDNAGEQARPASETQVVSTIMTLSEIITQINNVAGLPNVTASASLDFKLVLTRTNNSSTNASLILAGSSLSILGLLPSYSANTIQVPTYSTLPQAVSDINQTLTDNLITDVVVTISNNRILITTPTNSLLLGDTSFNTIAGLPTGEVVSTAEEADNDTPPTVPLIWENISHLDPALFNIWTADDSTYEVEIVDGIITKFLGWNVFQVQNQNMLYSKSDSEVIGIDGNPGTCGICAGNTTRDGNDAQVTLQQPHNLAVGDYVMLLNTTTVPNIDGIHKITKLGTGINPDLVFYIDRFIEECGEAVSVLPLRTQRFDNIAERDAALASTYWNPPPDTLSWSNRDISGTRTTNVFNLVYDVNVSGADWVTGNFKSQTIWGVERKTTHRVTNNDISYAVVYDINSNAVINEFELFDPLRGIIPGIADKELDFKSVFDPSTYTHTTDIGYSVDAEDSWATAQVGMRWWDMSKARYYDYDQGSLLARATWWGKGFNDSEIVVWEWIKSAVAPDDYAEAVAGNIEMFGTIATGEAYAKYDPIANETLYYYTVQEEWEPTLSKNRDVYYFWVKNKETIQNKKHTLTARAVADIISDPSAQGISWIAAISSDAVIVSNINYSLTDNSTILQINKKISGHAHADWMLIAKDVDVIPEYWYIGMRNNLSAQDAYEVNIPSTAIHKLNRYGDDRSIGQAWFDDINIARVETVSIINDLLVGINLIEEFRSTWNRELTREISPGRTFPASFWKWADFISDTYDEYKHESYEIADTAELALLDPELYSMIKLEVIDAALNLDRSEYYAHNGTYWELVKKNNATIAFDPAQLSLMNSWDSEVWDSASWDNTFTADYWKVLIDACRNDFFVGEYKHKFNKLFFGIVDHVLSRFAQPNWIHKSTYIQLNIAGELETAVRRYKRDQTNEILGYINTIKPFHTKISNIKQSHRGTDSVALELTETIQKVITLGFSNHGDTYYSGTLYFGTDVIDDLTFAPTGSNIYVVDSVILDDNNWVITTVTVGGILVDEFDDYVVEGQTIKFDIAPTAAVVVSFERAQETIISGGSFATDDSQFAEIADSGEFIQPYNYPIINGISEGIPYQSTLLPIRPIELLNIIVQTNRTGATVDSETRTFVYIQDHNESRNSFGLVNDSATTLATALAWNNTTSIALTDGSAFASTGLAFVDGEIISFNRNGNTLYIIQRAINGTFSTDHAAASTVVDVTAAVLSTITGTGIKFNQIGSSILDSFDNIEPSELAAIGQGLEI